MKLAVTDDLHSVSKLASKIIQIKDVVDFVQIREKTKTVQEIISLLKLFRRRRSQKGKNHSSMIDWILHC